MKSRSILLIVGAVSLAVIAWWKLSPSGSRQRPENPAANRDPSTAAPDPSPAANPHVEKASSRQAETKLETREQINQHLKLLAGVELPLTAHTFTNGRFTIPIGDVDSFLQRLNTGLDKNNKQKWTDCGISQLSGADTQRAHDGLRYTKASLFYRMVPVRPGIGMPQPSYGLTVDPTTGAAYLAMTAEYDE